MNEYELRLEALRLALSNPIASTLPDDDLITLAGKYFAFLSGAPRLTSVVVGSGGAGRAIGLK